MKTPTQRFVCQFFHLHPNAEPKFMPGVTVGTWTWCLTWSSETENENESTSTFSSSRITEDFRLLVKMRRSCPSLSYVPPSLCLLASPQGSSQSQLSTDPKLTVQDATADKWTLWLGVFIKNCRHQWTEVMVSLCRHYLWNERKNKKKGSKRVTRRGTAFSFVPTKHKNKHKP